MDVEEIVLKLLMALVVAICVAAIVIFPLAVQHDSEKEAAFMAECEKDRKHYECEAMWRAGNSSDSTILPVPVVVPVR